MDEMMFSYDCPYIPVTPPPTRAETIKAAWELTRPLWATHSRGGGLIATADYVEPMLFLQLRYGDTWVIECEGVIVERLAAK